MILYNLRHRGPYEYDKFVLNILQYCNEVKDAVANINNSDSSDTLYKYDKYIDDLLTQNEHLEKQIAYILEVVKQ